jgi:hypothetical protein
MLWPSTLYRDGLKTILKDMGRSKVRFHAFRRFRQAALEKSEVRQLLIDFWLGHDNSDMSSRYAKQLTEDVEFRQEWAKRVRLGFELKELLESEPGLNCATCDRDSVKHACVVNAGERPDTWVTVCTGHTGDTSSPRGGSDALDGVFGYG